MKLKKEIQAIKELNEQEKQAQAQKEAATIQAATSGLTGMANDAAVTAAGNYKLTS